MRRAEPGERRARSRRRRSSRATRASSSVSSALLDDPEPVAQPLHRGAGDEDRRLERVVRAVARSPRRPSSSRPSAAARARSSPALSSTKRAGAVGVLAEPGLEAAPGRTARPAGRRRCRRPAPRGRGTRRRACAPNTPRSARTLGQRALGTRRTGSSSSASQRPLADVEQQRARRVGRSVTCSPVSLKSSQESIVPNTARPSRARSRSPSTLRSSHSIFVAEKYGSSTSPVRSRTSGSSPGLAQLVAARRRAPVLPDDRAVQRLAVSRVPGARRSRAGW